LLPVLLLSLALTACQRDGDVVTDGIRTAAAIVAKQTPDWCRNTTIYEVNLRQYSPSGSFSAFAEHLPRLKEMGVTILWLMPIHPIGVENRKGGLGSYYSVRDYLGVNPEHGTLADFKRLVEQVHAQGMYIILDWVANHCAWDHPWVDAHPDWFSRDAKGNMYPPVPDWSDVVDLNYDNHAMRRAMIEALCYWVRETGIDGYRCDVAGMVPFDFWRAARLELDRIKPVFMLAEWEEPELHEAFEMSYAWGLHDVMREIARGERGATAVREYYEQNRRDYPAGAIRMNFTSNHDENSWNGTVFERLGEGVEAFAVLTALLPGMPLVYSGQEAGLDRPLAFFDKDPIAWREHPCRELYRKLLNLHQGNAALWNGAAGGEPVWLETTHDETVCAFSRERERDKVVALFNLSGLPQQVELSGISLRGDYRELFSETESTVAFTERAQVELPPWGYRVYVAE